MSELEIDKLLGALENETNASIMKLTNAKIKYTDPPEYTKSVDVGNFLVDNSKLSSLDWKPKVTVKDGIEKTIQFFKNKN